MMYHLTLPNLFALRHLCALCKVVNYGDTLLIVHFSLMKMNVYPGDEVLFMTPSHPKFYDHIKPQDTADTISEL
jgi:hypothetical protein